MSERKIVKVRVDMYSDTKFKIIDTMKDRDLIHYIWIRLLTLAGRVNLEGNLYLSKSIPYNIETLALEFNRNIEKVELALKVFIDLEMVELTKDNVYRVKNFVKHQNIKSKKKADIIEKGKCNGEEIDKCIEFTGGINKSQFNNDDIDNNYSVENKKEVLENSKNEINIAKNILGDKSENSKCDLDIKKNCEEKIALYREKDIDIVENYLESGESKINNSKVIDFKNIPKDDVDVKNDIKIKDDNIDKKDNIIDNSVLVEYFDKLESTNNTKDSVDKLGLDKNLLDNQVKLEDKVNVEKEFVLSKGNSKKKKHKPKKKDKDVYVISDWEEDDNIQLCKDDDSTELCEDGKDIELCEFGDKIPEGEVVTIFKF